jgi:ketosteroid isomerase-like protein
MSQENVELTYRAFDAFNRRDFDAFLALMDDDVEVFSRLVPWRAAITAATESVAGASS